MGNRQSTLTPNTAAKDQVETSTTATKTIARATEASPASSPFITLPPEVRTMIYNYVLSDFEINTAPAKDRDLAQPLLNVCRSVSEEALASYEKRIRDSREEASNDLKVAVVEMCATLLTDRLPTVEARRRKVAVCDEELAMIGVAKKEYKME